MSRRTRADRGDAWWLFEPQTTVSMFLGTVTVASYSVVVMTLGTAAVAWHTHSDAGNLPTFIAAKAVVESSSHVELWRGLPRASSERDRAANAQRAFGLFEPTPLELSDQEAQWLRDYCAQGYHFDVLEPGVYKLCGGFHADWAVVFTSCGYSAEFAFCDGCGEAKIQTDESPFLHVDVRDRLLHTYLEDRAK